MPPLLETVWELGVLYVPIGVIGLWRWSAWFVRKVIALRYRPSTAAFSGNVSIVTPVYNERADVFEAALESWRANAPAEIIAVIDASDTSSIHVFRGFAKLTPGAKLIVTRVPGKRPALAEGIRAATSDIIALVDSDTIWEPTTMREVMLPFRDGKVGGVATRQNVLRPATVAQKLFDIQLDLRYEEELPFLGASGNALTCLSGRTAVYRRAALLPVLDAMVHETFWGTPVISGEDKRLTYLVLANGWKLKFQNTARVYTHGTEHIRSFLKQRLRWTRNSWRADLRTLSQRWIWRHPALAYLLTDRFIQPFVLLLGFSYFVAALLLGYWPQALVLAAWWMATRTIRLFPHLKRRPQDVLVLPHYILYTYVTAIIRLYALFTLNAQGWITRWDPSRLVRLSLIRKLPAYAATAACIAVFVFASARYQRGAVGTSHTTYFRTTDAATVHPSVGTLSQLPVPLDDPE